MRRRDFAKRLFSGAAVAAVIGAKDDEESKLSDVKLSIPEERSPAITVVWDMKLVNLARFRALLREKLR